MRPCLASLSLVTHIGTLDPTHKGVRGPSQEGLGVSFSLHPRDWEKIAKLGGQPWWTADLSSCQLLDGHAFVKENGPALERWGLDAGLVQAVPAWRVSWFDEELDDTVCFLAGSHQEAEDETDFQDDATIEEVSALAPTPGLVQAMGAPPSDIGKPSLSALQDLATIWAQRKGLDGVWWNDIHDPQALSAPRGVIFPDRVATIEFTRAEVPTQTPRRSRRP